MGAWKRRRYSRYSRRCETLAVALVRRSLVPCASRGVSQNINLRLQIISCVYVYYIPIYIYRMRVFTRRDNFSLDFSFPARTRTIEFSKRILLCKFLYKGDNRPVDPVKIATVVTNISRKGYFPFQKSTSGCIDHYERSRNGISGGSGPLILVDPIFHRVLYF